MTDKFSQENTEKYCCNFCNVKCSHYSEWKRHILTQKHKNLINTDKNTDNTDTFDNKNNNTYNCSCGKKYKHRQSLFTHKKTCTYKQEDINLENSLKAIIQPLEEKIMAIESEKMFAIQNTNNNDISLIPEIIKQSQEFQKEIFQKMMEFMKNSNNIITTNSHNTNNNYTQFNLQLYLNETCKNAMTIDEFLDYLQPTIEELEETARLGYVEGITRIIMRGLKDLEEELRPFHCSDLKRETLFIKNTEGEWEKDSDDKTIMIKFVKEVGRKNFNNVHNWKKMHPNCKSYDSKSNDMFNQILLNSTSGSTEEQQKNSYEKVIKNITKEVVINKSKKNSK